jgi:hypothetical protein
VAVRATRFAPGSKLRICKVHVVLGLNDNDALEQLVDFQMGSNYILSDFGKTVWRVYQAILYITFLLLFATIDTSTSSDFHHLPKSIDWPSAKTKVLL